MYAKESLSISKESDWQHGLYKSLLSYADVYKYCLKDYAEATKYYEMLMQLAIEDSNEPELIAAYYELALISDFSGKYKTSISYYEKIIELNISNEELISIYGNIAQVYYKVNDYPNAINAMSNH